jgi:tetratricopeptide (TPR) repeat protein
MGSLVQAARKPLSRTEELREKLGQLNARVGRLGHGAGNEPWEILKLYDDIQITINALHAEGYHMRAEEALLEEASAGLQKKAGTFLREIGGASALRDARRDHHPAQERWWWYLDEWQASRKRRMLRRVFIQVIVVAGVLSILWFLYQRFFAPDAETQARFDYQQRAIESDLQGDLQAALDSVEKGLEIAPQDSEFLLLKGAILRQLEKPEESEQAFAEAESTFDDRAAFLDSRAQVYISLGMPEATLADVQELLLLEPESARGYFLMGEADEMLGYYTEAIEAYERVSQLAQDSDTELVVLARIRLGMLLQAPPLPTE